jgi:tRNA nucleotidyltransferase (CCA-adding enzyme)
MNQEFVRARPVLEQLTARGYEAYFVGGAVRDTLMGKEIDDVDIATSATPEQVKEIFTYTVDVGIEHGTVLVLYKGDSFEITTFRTETSYKDHRRPDAVTFVTSLYEDLKRRDFTMNAIAMDQDGKLYDPFNGEEAILKKIIQTVGEADERFSEDALRILRAVRFVSQLGFILHEETKRALRKNAHLLLHIAQERKTAEFQKMILGQYPHKGLKIAAEEGLLTYFPGLGPLAEHMDKFLSLPLSGIESFEEWMALIALFSGQDQSLYRQWKLSSNQMKKIGLLTKEAKKRDHSSFTPYTIYQLGLEDTLSVERVWSAYHEKAPDFESIKSMHAHMPSH